MPTIHPTSLVDRNAKLADDVVIGPYTIIGPRVTIGRGTTIGAHCVIEGCTTIGQRNRIFPRVTMGQEPQDLKYRGEETTLEVGDYNDIREFVTMHVGTAVGGGKTTVGSHNLLMVNAHVAHDSHIGSHCILANNVMLAGHVIVKDFAVVSGAAAISHFCTIGEYAFIGGLAGVVTDCLPFCRSDGHPARPKGINTVHLRRHKFEEASIQTLERAYRAIYGRKASSVAAGLEEAESRFGNDPRVMKLITFIRAATVAPHGRTLEATRPDNKQASPTR